MLIGSDENVRNHSSESENIVTLNTDPDQGMIDFIFSLSVLKTVREESIKSTIGRYLNDFRTFSQVGNSLSIGSSSQRGPFEAQ